MLDAQGVSRIFRTSKGDVRALDDVTFHAGEGEFVVIRGASGSGKTTLLLALGGMLHPTSGRVSINDADLYGLSVRERAAFRADHVGFVFQMFHLVPYLTVLDNVLLAAGASQRSVSRGDAAAALEQLGLAHRQHHTPPQLSAGEKQRAAIARAMINKPKVILADEPTGNLDPENAAEVIAGLVRYQADGGTVVVVTHGTAADEHADRIVRLRDGRIEA